MVNPFSPSKKSIVLIALLPLILAVTVLVAFWSPSVAEAFTVEFPTDNYLQIESASFISATEGKIAVYDDAKNTIFIKSADNVSVLNLPENINASALHLFGKTVLVETSSGLLTADVSVENLTLTPVIINTPEDISSLFSDGTYLYAKSDFGFISVYDDSFNAVYQNVKNTLFAGKPVIAAENRVLYVFSTDSGVPYYTSLNLSDGQTSATVAAPSTVTAAASGELLFVLKDGILTAIDKSNAAELFSTGLSPERFTAFGRDVFTVENSVLKHYKLSDDNGSLSYVASLGMTGDDAEHLNHPSDIAAANGRKVIADTFNNRLLSIDGNNITSIPLHSPKSVVIGKGTVYAANDYGLYAINDYGEQSAFTFDQKIIDVAYLDTPYILTSNGIYVLTRGSFIKFAEVSGATAIAAAEDGNYIYALSENGVAMYSTAHSAAASVFAACNLDGAVDLKVDYSGNVFVLFNDRLVKYSNGITFLSEIETYALTQEGTSSTAISFSVDEVAYFITKESFLGANTVNFATKNDHIFGEKPHISTPFSSKFYTLKTDKTVVYPISGRMDDCCILADKSPLLVFTDIKDAGGNVYAVFNDDLLNNDFQSAKSENDTANPTELYHFGYINLNDFEEAAPTSVNKTYVASAKTPFYAYPGTETAVYPNGNTRITVLNNAANFDNGIWLRAEFNGTVYFVKTDDVKPYVEVVQKDNKKFGTAKASRAGGTVKIYALPSADSTVLDEITDGTKVEVLSNENGFYLILYNDMVGYIIKNELQLGGLTTVQLIAVIISVTVLLAGALVFFIIYRAKRTSEKSDDNKRR